MAEYRSVLERAAASAPPVDLELERLLRRSERRRRHQRITAGIVGIAVFVAAVWLVTTSPFGSVRTGVPGGSTMGPTGTGPTGAEPTYGGPTYTLGPVTPKDIAVGESFMGAWTRGDGAAAEAMFATEGTFDGFDPAILPALHDWFRAEGWTFESEACGIHGLGPQRGVVGCSLTYENDITRALGLPPMGTGLSFVIDPRGIETAWYGAGGDVELDSFAGYRGREDVFGPVWNTFIDWISSNHPDDVGRMYEADRGYPVLDATSLELWTRYTTEFLASPEAEEMARSIRDDGWDGVGFPPEGTAPSTPEIGELVASYGRGGCCGSGYVFVYADGRVISGGGIADVNGTPMEQRLTDQGIGLVRSGAVQPEDFLFSSDPVPAGAWEDPEIKPYVPSRYAICFYQESGDANPGTINHGYEYPDRVIPFFPARAREILRGQDHTYDEDGPEGPIECSEVTTDQARTLDAILHDVDVVDAEGDPIAWEVDTLLPHGGWVITAR